MSTPPAPSSASAAREERVYTRETRQLSAQVAEQLAQQTRPVEAFWRERYETQGGAHWDLFYKRHGDGFFKDRHYLSTEFQHLLQPRRADNGDDGGNDGGNDGGEAARRLRVLEVGCGVGNTVFPLLRDAARVGLAMRVDCCDYARTAVALVRAHEDYAALHARGDVEAHVADLTSEADVAAMGVEGEIDVCSMVFVLSAIAPHRWRDAVRHVASTLRVGGHVVLRDYARYDLAQLRFPNGRRIGDNYYVRGDKTLTYFYTLDEIEALMAGAGLSTVSSTYIEKDKVNRKEGTVMPRVWVQGCFEKTADWEAVAEANAARAEAVAVAATPPAPKPRSMGHITIGLAERVIAERKRKREAAAEEAAAEHETD